MYGMVNNFLQYTIIDLYGVESWNKISISAQLKNDLHFELQEYDDKITYDIIFAASQIVDEPVESLLFNLGCYWVPYTCSGLYSSYYNRVNNSLDFITEINQLHDDVRSEMPLVKPPAFRIERLSRDSGRLHYMSERPGLRPFLQGVLQGLAEFYGETLSMDIEDPTRFPDSRHTFLLEIKRIIRVGTEQSQCQ